MSGADGKVYAEISRRNGDEVMEQSAISQEERAQEVQSLAETIRLDDSQFISSFGGGTASGVAVDRVGVEGCCATEKQELVGD